MLIFDNSKLFSVNNKKKNDNDDQGTGNIKVYENVVHVIHCVNLPLLSIMHNQKQDNDDDQGAKNVEAGHNISCCIHKNYLLIIDTLEYQIKIERIAPKNIIQ